MDTHSKWNIILNIPKIICLTQRDINAMPLQKKGMSVLVQHKYPTQMIEKGMQMIYLTYKCVIALPSHYISQQTHRRKLVEYRVYTSSVILSIDYHSIKSYFPLTAK